jgi:acyl-CoA synthetase (AMP-forming)/AMP-acid ligase II
VVQPAAGATAPSAEELVAYCKQHLAGYKVPKHVVLVEAVVRSPAGKADYRWALDTAEAAVTAS